jgi:hypothetical protein
LEQLTDVSLEAIYDKLLHHIKEGDTLNRALIDKYAKGKILTPPRIS